VGKVAALNTMPVQDLLVVETPDGKEILIPFVEQIVPEVNIEEGFVLLTPPDGLFEINEEGGAEDPETRGSDSAEDSDEDPTVEDAEPEAKA
jgi:16S rRNA processing protein RimM